VPVGTRCRNRRAVGTVPARLILLGDVVTGRGHHLHLVVAGIDVAEQVVAARVGRGGGHHGAGRVEQLDGHALDAGFARVLDAVVVHVLPHPVTDGSLLVEARIPRQVVFAGDQRGGDGLAGGRVEVAVGRVVAALILRADEVAGRRHHLGSVIARGQVAEQVVAVGVGGSGRDHGTGAVEQLHGNAGQAGFTCVLHAVGVGVEPHLVAVRSGAHGRNNPCIQGLVDLTGLEHRLRGSAISHVGVGVGGVTTAVGRGEAVAGRQRGLIKLHAVGARAQVGKEVVAGGIRRERAAYRIARSIEQGYADTCHAGFTHILLAIGVGVDPHTVAQRCRAVETGVNRQVLLTGTDRDLRRLQGRGIEVTVGAVTTLIRQRYEIAGRRHDAHRVSPRHHIEQVVAVGIRSGGLHNGACAVEQIHGYTGNTRLACILGAIAIPVLPNSVAQAARECRSRVVRGIGVGGLATGNGIRAHCGTDVHILHARLDRLGGRVNPGFAHVELVVAVGVTPYEGQIGDAVVGHRDVRERNITRVGHAVSKDRLSAHRNHRTNEIGVVVRGFDHGRAARGGRVEIRTQLVLSRE
jgi:hypothetical protein